MIQLEKRGFVDMRKQGNAFVYYPVAGLMDKIMNDKQIHVN